MPIFRNKVSSGQFDGLTDTTGLFNPKTGSDRIQVRINSLMFHVAPAAGTSDLTITVQDPEDPANEPVIFSGGVIADLYVFQGFLLTTENITSWPLKVITTTLGGEAWLSIDYDFESTEGA